MDCKKVVEKQRAFFAKGHTKDVTFRQKALFRLEKKIRQWEPQILEALQKDLNKAQMESFMTELGLVYHSIADARNNVEHWSRRKQVSTPLSLFQGHSFIYPEPYGIVLVMAPWNYPFLLSLDPLIGAIAAGNCVVLKPSAYAPAASQVLADLLADTFPSEYVAVMQGGREENQQLLEERWDYIFFTGGVTVGKQVMEKAARNLTPVTLELGGKSPCIVGAGADLNMAAKRIVFGKFVNSGQTCIAPDYILVQEYAKEDLLRYMKKWIRRMLGEDPLQNPEYPKIINRRHYDRLINLIKDQQVYVGGQGDPEKLKITPTILTDVKGSDPVMQEEIFGPVLPVLTYMQLEEAEQFVLDREKPLALYLFTQDPKVMERVLNRLSFGGGCINDTLMHIANPHMGFGGIGYSGMGQYHGKKSFDTFTHEKSVIDRAVGIDLPMRYHPYSDWKEKIIRKVMD